jgi:hypothetical protein
MSTNRFTLDADGNRAYIGGRVYYRNKVWVLKDINYLKWNKEQYLTLQDLHNKNKNISYIKPNQVLAVRR